MSDSPHAAAVKRIEQRAARMRHKIGDPLHVCRANQVDGKLAPCAMPCSECQQAAARGEAVELRVVEVQPGGGGILGHLGADTLTCARGHSASEATAGEARHEVAEPWRRLLLQVDAVSGEAGCPRPPRKPCLPLRGRLWMCFCGCGANVWPEIA